TRPRPTPANLSDLVGISWRFWKKTLPSPSAAFLTVPTTRLVSGSVPPIVIVLISVFESSRAGLPLESSCLTTDSEPGPINRRVKVSPSMSVPDTTPESSWRLSKSSAAGRYARLREEGFRVDIDQTPNARGGRPARRTRVSDGNHLGRNRSAPRS